jgi:benzoate transport
LSSQPVRADDLTEAIRTKRMSGAQVMAVALCTVINMVDGFDILVASFTAPAIASEWGLSARQLGLLFSAGLAGMTLGALGLSPLADRLGRRRTVLMALTLVSVGMIGSAISAGPHALMFARLTTGVGVGAMMPTINTVVAEFSNARRRDLAVCLQGAGFPLGGALGGFVVLGLSHFGWRPVFLAGGLFSFALIPLVLARLPESIDFLLERRPPNALFRLNRLLARVGLQPVHELPTVTEGARGVSWREFAGKFGVETLLMAGAFFLLMYTFYFLTSWMPKLLTDSGLSAAGGISAAILVNLGGFVGDLLFSALVFRWPAAQVGPVFMLGCVASVFALSVIPMNLMLVVPLALTVGFLLFGSMLSLYAFVPTIYPATARNTGTGIALGLGRIGATVGPYVGGVMIASGWHRTTYLSLMALPLVAAAIILRLLSASSRTPAVTARIASGETTADHDAAAYAARS